MNYNLTGISATVHLRQTMSHATNVVGPTTTAIRGERLTLTVVAAVASQGVQGAKWSRWLFFLFLFLKMSRKEEERRLRERKNKSWTELNFIDQLFIIIEVDENQNFHVIFFLFFSTLESLSHNVCFTFNLGIISWHTYYYRICLVGTNNN